MAMQQSGKGASGSGAPALTDEDADQFAAGFTPAWDSGDSSDDAPPPPPPPPPAAADEGIGDKTLSGGAATLVDAVSPGAIAAAIAAAAPAPAPAPVVAPAPAPAPAFNAKQTLIGTAPQANPPPALVTSTVIMNVHSAQTATAALKDEPTSAKAGPTSGPTSSGDGRWQEKVPSRPPPGPPPAARNNTANAAAASVTADPFNTRPATPNARVARAKSVTASDEHDLVPKKSSKTALFVIAGLAVAAGLGLFLKFALSDDAPKTPPTTVSLGPAATTADIPPPPPKVDTPPPATAAASATVAAVTTKVDTTPPTPLALPPTRPTPVAAADPPQPHVDTPPRSLLQPRPARTPPAAALPPATPPAAPATPKTAPKSPNGGIVRDNPF